MKNHILKKNKSKTCKTRNYSRRRILQTAVFSTVTPFSASVSPAENKKSKQKKVDNLFWGDLHTHTNLSDGNGTPEDNFEIARKHLDFWTMADHAYDEIVFHRYPSKIARGEQFLNDHWERIQKLCRDYEKNGQFIPFLGYEWTSFCYGHHNVYYLQYDQPIRIPSTLPELYASLRNVDALVIPHHTGYPVRKTGKDWNFYDEHLSPFAEIYSIHGSSEEPCGVTPLLTGGSWMGPGESGTSIQEGLARGYQFGIIASTDSHGGHPGVYDLGLMGVHAKELRRKSLWEAFRNRRVYGVTGDRISLDFSLNGYPMGSVVNRSKKRNITILATGWDKIDRIDVIKNNSLFHSFIEPSGLPEKNKKIRFRFFLEWGWDNTEDREWDGRLTVSEGRILQAVPCFRGSAANLIGNGIKNLSESDCIWKSKTEKVSYPIYLRQYADAIAFEVECSENDILKFNFTCSGMKREIKVSPGGILGECKVIYMEDIPPENKSNYWNKMKSHAKFKIHQGWLTEQLTVNLTCEDNFPEHSDGRADYYYIRLIQKNKQRAWSSPIWCST
ncbi:hypothetical protein ACFL2X_06730 [Candidatus Latescibacterota bacterium]